MAKAEMEICLRGKTPEEWRRIDAVLTAAVALLEHWRTDPFPMDEWEPVKAVADAAEALQKERE